MSSLNTWSTWESSTVLWYEIHQEGAVTGWLQWTPIATNRALQRWYLTSQFVGGHTADGTFEVTYVLCSPPVDLSSAVRLDVQSLQREVTWTLGEGDRPEMDEGWFDLLLIDQGESVPIGHWFTELDPPATLAGGHVQSGIEVQYFVHTNPGLPAQAENGESTTVRYVRSTAPEHDTAVPLWRVESMTTRIMLDQSATSELLTYPR